MNKKIVGISFLIITLSIIIIYKYLNQDVPAPKFEAGVNEYVYKEVTDRTMVSVYFNNYIATLLSNPSKAYKMITSNTKQKQGWNTLEQFNKYISDNRQKIAKQQLKEYQAGSGVQGKTYIGTTNDGITYTFIPSSVMEYQVSITNK